MVDPATRCVPLEWAASGGMALTGHTASPPLLSPAPAFGLACDVARTLTTVTGAVGTAVTVDPAEVLFGRAGLRGLRRAGQRSAAGASRLLRTADGWCSITLGRTEDIDSVPALLGVYDVEEPWAALASAAQRRTAAALVGQARLLGIPAAVLPGPTPQPAPTVPWRVSRIADSLPAASLDGSLVVDLSALWAGPLCGRILGAAGAQVIKVESIDRPDAMRTGDPDLFEWLHQGQQSRTIDFRSGPGRRELADLLDAADIVIEASRPRALAQLGLAPQDRAHRPGRVWLSITGYGRAHPMRVAFGDDAAVAGGLVGWSAGEPVFCGDAIADPLTGLCGALGVAAAVREGGGVLIDLAMRTVASTFAAAPAFSHGPHHLGRDSGNWVVECGCDDRTRTVAPPRPIRALC